MICASNIRAFQWGKRSYWTNWFSKFSYDVDITTAPCRNSCLKVHNRNQEENVIKMSKRLLTMAITSGMFISLSACNGVNNQADSDARVENAGQENLPKQNSVPTPMNLKGQVEFAKKDLAQRLSVNIELVKVASAEAVTWRSGALGCPERGKMYPDALVPGSVIYLQVENITYAYHAKFAGEPFNCPNERVESPVLKEGVDQT